MRNKKDYEAWKAAFNSCVDRGRATAEYKLLRLRECLQGEALKLVKNLGHSAAAYKTAKTRLEQKYGGKCQALTLRMEELDAFKPIRDGNQKDLEGLAELLDNCCQSNRRQTRSRIGKWFTVHHYPTEA